MESDESGTGAEFSLLHSLGGKKEWLLWGHIFLIVYLKGHYFISLLSKIVSYLNDMFVIWESSKVLESSKEALWLEGMSQPLKLIFDLKNVSQQSCVIYDLQNAEFRPESHLTRLE